MEILELKVQAPRAGSTLCAPLGRSTAHSLNCHVGAATEHVSAEKRRHSRHGGHRKDPEAVEREEMILTLGGPEKRGGGEAGANFNAGRSYHHPQGAHRSRRAICLPP